VGDLHSGVAQRAHHTRDSFGADRVLLGQEPAGQLADEFDIRRRVGVRRAGLSFDIDTPDDLPG